MNTGNSWNVKLHLPSTKLRSPKNFLSKLLGKLDFFTREHSFRVRDLSLRLGEIYGLEKEDLEHLGKAALFHDIGKIEIEREILFKNRKLSAEEQNRIRCHPEIGARLWLQAGGYYRVSESILSHHENYDGSGYPFGLCGEKIPFWARVITIADSLDAMLSERPYKQANGLTPTLHTLRNASGRQFDPVLIEKVDTCLEQGCFENLYTHEAQIPATL